MWRSWTIGFLGAWTVLVVLVISPGTTQKILLVLTGLVVSSVSFSKVLTEHRGEQMVIANSKEKSSGEDIVTENSTANE